MWVVCMVKEKQPIVKFNTLLTKFYTIDTGENRFFCFFVIIANNVYGRALTTYLL